MLALNFLSAVLSHGHASSAPPQLYPNQAVSWGSGTCDIAEDAAGSDVAPVGRKRSLGLLGLQESCISGYHRYHNCGGTEPLTSNPLHGQRWEKVEGPHRAEGHRKNRPACSDRWLGRRRRLWCRDPSVRGLRSLGSGILPWYRHPFLRWVIPSACVE